MARKKSFSSLVNQIAREAARAEREKQKRLREQQRVIEKARREAERARKLAEKEAKELYIEYRFSETEELNQQLNEKILELANILPTTLDFDDTISFNDLRIHEDFREFMLPAEFLIEPDAPEKQNYLVKKPNFIEQLIPGSLKRHEKALSDAKNKFYADMKKFEEDVEFRKEKIDTLRKEYDKERLAFEEKINQRNNEIDLFEKEYYEGAPDAVAGYCTMVLERSEYPDAFPQEFRLAYIPEPKELVIPEDAEYSYIKTKDEIRTKARTKTLIKETYKDVVASICLRTIHEVFEADQGKHLDVVVFSGFVQTIDPATGHDIRPYLISVRTTKEKFLEINLARVDKVVCLRNLGAQVSPRPEEAVAVKPIVEFNMVDSRFVEQSDVLSDLESRPNLMDLDPFEFENLVSNLFDQLGFETRQTRTSKDGGVDAIAFDTRPIVGGKLVVQAKRYKNVVGVSATRDLYGTMINEGANKGILVTTSHYGADAYEFVKDKPIELIDGGGLLYLLDQIGVSARIVFPDD